MDFTCFTTAIAQEFPVAIGVMGLLHVTLRADDALDACRRRIQQDFFGGRGCKGDPLHMARRTVHTGKGLLSKMQQARLGAQFVNDNHVRVEVTWFVSRDTDTINGRLGHLCAGA